MYLWQDDVEKNVPKKIRIEREMRTGRVDATEKSVYIN